MVFSIIFVSDGSVKQLMNITFYIWDNVSYRKSRGIKNPVPPFCELKNLVPHTPTFFTVVKFLESFID